MVTHSIEGNPNLICPDGLCVNKSGNGGSKKTNVVVPVVASVAFLVVLGSALAYFFVFKKKRTSNSEGIHTRKLFNWHTHCNIFIIHIWKFLLNWCIVITLGLSSYTQVSDARTTRSSEPAIMTKNRRFTYAEVVTMTNNFKRVLGKGGFGMVYHGTVNGTEQVAVKMLSHSSSQGYKEFKAEVISRKVL